MTALVVFVAALLVFLVLFLLRAFAPSVRSAGASSTCPTCSLPFPRTLSRCPDCGWRPEGAEIVLTEMGPDPEAALRVVREVTGVGSREARRILRHLPGTVKCGVGPEEANRMREAFASVGARVEIR